MARSDDIEEDVCAIIFYELLSIKPWYLHQHFQTHNKVHLELGLMSNLIWRPAPYSNLLSTTTTILKSHFEPEQRRLVNSGHYFWIPMVVVVLRFWSTGFASELSNADDCVLSPRCRFLCCILTLTRCAICVMLAAVLLFEVPLDDPFPVLNLLLSRLLPVEHNREIFFSFLMINSALTWSNFHTKSSNCLSFRYVKLNKKIYKLSIIIAWFLSLFVQLIFSVKRYFKTLVF